MSVENLPQKESRSDEFESLLEEHMDTVYLSALHLTKNPADARDLQQDALVRALRFHYQFKPGTYIKAWLSTIVRNTFLNDFRRKSRRPYTVELTGDENPVTPANVSDPDMKYCPKAMQSSDILEYLSDDVREAIESLPEGHRRAVVMADLQGMSYREIAEALECPVGTVMSRLNRGRRLMRDALGGGRAQFLNRTSFA